jgi:hypothetical protein
MRGKQGKNINNKFLNLIQSGDKETKERKTYLT